MKMAKIIMMVFFVFLHVATGYDCSSITPKHASNEASRLLFNHTGRYVWKLMHYPALYDLYFHRFKTTCKNMLEIGILGGGDIQIWHQYFESAKIHGLDINPATKGLECPYSNIHVGSQADPQFLKEIVKEHGPFDIIFDDGSHIPEHVIISFDNLFEAVRPGGLYWVEDFYYSDQVHSALHLLNNTLDKHCVHVHPSGIAIEKGGCSPSVISLKEVLGLDGAHRQHSTIITLVGGVSKDVCWQKLFTGDVHQVSTMADVKPSTSAHNVVVIPSDLFEPQLVTATFNTHFSASVFVVGDRPCMALLSKWKALVSQAAVLLVGQTTHITGIHCLPDTMIIQVRHPLHFAAFTRPVITESLDAIAQASEKLLKENKYPC